MKQILITLILLDFIVYGLIFFFTGYPPFKILKIVRERHAFERAIIDTAKDCYRRGGEPLVSYSNSVKIACHIL